MSDQDLHRGNAPDGEPALPDPTRRRIAKLGLAAPPVIVSLAARPVWSADAMCLSEMLSGNMSRVQESCVTGQCPEFWSTNLTWPGGATPGDNTENPAAGLCDPGWTGGTTYSSLFGGADGRTLREILCADLCSTESLVIAAYFNALTVTGYVLRPGQVLQLALGMSPPGRATLADFLKYTMPGCCL